MHTPMLYSRFNKYYIVVLYLSEIGAWVFQLPWVFKLYCGCFGVGFPQYGEFHLYHAFVLDFSITRPNGGTR